MAAQTNKWIVALTVMLPTLMVIMDTSVVNVSLDHIRGSLSAGIDEATWSITSYLAANAIIVPMTGWLSRLIGRKRYLIFSVTLFTLSSLLCGISWNIQSLIFFRVLQGISGGSLQPISQSILLETFPPVQHGMAMAIYGIGIMFGPIIGPFVGGWITDNWSWSWIFYINIPIGIISVLMSVMFIVDPDYMQRAKMKIDYMGLAFLGIGVGCLQMVLDRGQREDWFASEFILWLSVISVIALVVFVFVEIFIEVPIVNLGVLKNTTFSLGNVIIFFILMNLFGGMVLLPIYLQTLMGYTATLAGSVLAPGGVASLITMPIVGQLMTRYSSKVLLVIGIIITTYSTFLMSQFNLLTDFNTVLWPRILLGAGMGFMIIPLTTLTLSRIRKEEMGNATSIFNLVRNLGGSFGVALTTTFLSRRSQFHQSRIIEHLTPFDMNYILGTNRAAEALHYRGFEPGSAGQGGLGVIYEQLLKEASMLSFNDVFYLLTITLIMMIPLVLFMKGIYHRESDEQRQ
jgi:MFS transporter, DHA2 family, multidrug resistance protein